MGATRKTTQVSAVPTAGSNVSTLPVMITQNDVLSSSAIDYLAGIDTANPPPPSAIERELIAQTNLNLADQNLLREPRDRFPSIKTLTFAQVARIMIAIHRVVRIAPSDKNTDRDHDLLAIYAEAGSEEGIYVTSEDAIRSIARGYDSHLTYNGAREVMTVLREEAPRTTRCTDPDLIAVANGIFHYDTKTLAPFDPAYVFLSKSAVPYDPAALSPVIADPQGDWEVETWMQTLSDDPQIVHLLWQVLGAIIRPHVRWNRSAWFYSESGNNGKGTLCELMRNLCGPSSYASIPIADFGKDFLLEPLTRASAIIVDENDVGVFIDKAANLKAVVTNDVISINRKHKAPIAYQFYGFMVQCLNEFPRVKDRSTSFTRRQIFVPFTKVFTGRERKAIKEDYLQRPDVLAYVLKRVLQMNYYVLDEPAATKAVMEEFKESNDPVRAFWNEFEERFVWDLLPFGFLYDLYKSWFADYNPSGSVVGRNQFITDMVGIVAESGEFYCSSKAAKHRPGTRMDAMERLIADFDLKAWQNPNYTGKEVAKMVTGFIRSPNYRGIQRYTVSAPMGPGVLPPPSIIDLTTIITHDQDQNQEQD